jgi:hypothetical protein
MIAPAVVSQTTMTSRSRTEEVYQQPESDLGMFQLVPSDLFTENDVAERLH